MKAVGLALAALFALTATAVALPASAQMGGMAPTSNSNDSNYAAPSKTSAVKGKPYEKDAITQGKKDAPPVLAASGAQCTMTDAAYVGGATGKDDKGQPVKQTIYEVSCSEGLGYVLVAPVGGTPKAYDCLALMGNAGLNCRLPENGDPKRSLAPVVAQVAGQCSVSDARYLGSRPSGENYYEVGCGSQPGFILQTARGQAPKRIGCDQVPSGGAMSCKFTSQAQLDAQANAAAATLLSKSGKACQLAKTRNIGELQSGDFAYEVSCQDGSGYILRGTAAGDFHLAINCANAGGACQLTDATKAESAEAGTYTRLAKAAGYQCDVGQYRFIGMDTNTHSEVVELQCTNRPDGALAMFPADNNAANSKIYDCVAAGALGQSCKLSDPAAVYGKYSQALAAKGRNTCKVSSAHWLAKTAEGTNYIEVGCSDGLPGWVMVMNGSTASDLLTCGQAKGAGAACTLPGNVK